MDVETEPRTLREYISRRRRIEASLYPYKAKQLYREQAKPYLSIFARVWAHLYPWGRKEYRGKRHELNQILGTPYTWGYLAQLRKGDKPMTVEIATRLLDHLRTSHQIQAGLIAELEVYLATKPAPRARGIAQVKDRDGTGVLRDGRGRGGRPKVSL